MGMCKMHKYVNDMMHGQTTQSFCFLYSPCMSVAEPCAFSLGDHVCWVGIQSFGSLAQENTDLALRDLCLYLKNNGITNLFGICKF